MAGSMTVERPCGSGKILQTAKVILHASGGSSGVVVSNISYDVTLLKYSRNRFGRRWSGRRLQRSGYSISFALYRSQGTLEFCALGSIRLSLLLGKSLLSSVELRQGVYDEPRLTLFVAAGFMTPGPVFTPQHINFPV